MAGRRHGFSSAVGAGGGGGGGGKDRLRTHMVFSSDNVDHSQKKKTRRKHNKLHSRIHQHDAVVQTMGPNDIDPADWTGNQRVVHFGPMAQRDPFFYYYPKGWDILYPAHFGFFPYRTKKFRGSSPTVCLSAFGVFLLVGGLVMTYLGYFVLYTPPWAQPSFSFLTVPPLQAAGPVFVFVGSLCLVAGFFWWFCSLQLFSERLRHSQPHHAPPRKTVHTRPFPKAVGKVDFSKNYPLQPPPPCYPVMANAYTEPALYTPAAEMKLYPPVMPGYSTLSLPHSYVGSPYNTLSARPEPHAASPVLENFMESSYHAGKMNHHYLPGSKK